MRGTIQNKVDRETHFTNEFDQFIAEPGEARVLVYNRFAQLMNDLERNDMDFPIFKKLVNVSRAKKLEKSHDPLALDDVHTNYEDPLTSTMLLLARAITQNFSTPTNNRLRTSSNTRNQAIIQGDRVNIQSRNSGNTSTVQCYNCSGKGHYARNCPKPRVRDSKYFMEQMMEEIEELSANICLMARIQPADNTSDAGPSYDSAFISENCWTFDYAQINALYKDFVPQKELSAEQKYFPSSFIPSDKNSNATPSIPASMPSESPLIIELDKIKNCFQRLSELIQKKCKRASFFYTSPEEIQLNDFCQDQLKPIVNELQFYFEFFKTLFQRDIKEMKDVFESTESELCELEKQNDFLKDQLLEVSLKHEVELSVLLNP
ncbi:integrase, catalytic region, zinc finger, CCHC-type containing protein [Tanacetum coccineum]